MPFALFWALFALCSALFCSILHLFFAVFRFSLFLLASAYCRTSLNSLCALLQLRFTLLCPPRYFNPFYIVFWYYRNTTHRNAIHTRNFASFRSALPRFALPRISLSFFLFPSLISPRSSLFYSALFPFAFSSRDVAHPSVSSPLLYFAPLFRAILFLPLPLSLLPLVPPLCSVSREPEALEKSEPD